MINLNNLQHFHCIGIGGSGMSGLARLLQQKGKSITGSDEKESSTTLALAHEGIQIHIGHASENLAAPTEIVIYSPAVPENNPEMIEAQKRNLPRLSYPQAVGLLTQEKKTICICGTHGKTTTTALIAASLLATQQDPTVIVGAPIQELNGRNEILGKGPYFVLESCEYRRAFLNFQPSIIVLTNIEIDHLDYYKNLEDYKNAFREFIEKLPSDGLLIANSDDQNIQSLLENNRTNRVKTFGRNQTADYKLEGSSIFKKNISEQASKKIVDLQLQIPGDHNLMNACAVVALASELNLDLEQVKKALEQYKGAARRFEIKGHIGTTTIIDDYGHHPTEIATTLKAARQKFGSDKKILCIFQPHQYSRTFKLLDDFAQAFHDADEVIIPNIFQVRDSEADLKNISATSLVEKISEHHPKVRLGNGLEKTIELVKNEIKNFDVVITMGAGDVWKIAEALMSSSRM